jgi:hypothetical protein
MPASNGVRTNRGDQNPKSDFGQRAVMLTANIGRNYSARMPARLDDTARTSQARFDKASEFFRRAPIGSKPSFDSALSCRPLQDARDLGVERCDTTEDVRAGARMPYHVDAHNRQRRLRSSWAIRHTGERLAPLRPAPDPACLRLGQTGQDVRRTSDTCPLITSTRRRWHAPCRARAASRSRPYPEQTRREMAPGCPRRWDAKLTWPASLCSQRDELAHRRGGDADASPACTAGPRRAYGSEVLSGFIGKLAQARRDGYGTRRCDQQRVTSGRAGAVVSPR